MKKRYLVMLAKDFDPLKFKLNCSFMSEKLDGVRALWLPFTRGWNFKTVPWANTARDDRDPKCSGLWTRRGKNIAAPEWFLDALPQIPLDGELFMGRGRFNDTTSTVRKLEPVDSEWQGITYQVFDIPSYFEFFRHGDISEGGRAVNPDYKAFFPITCPYPKLKESPWWNPKRFTDVLYHLQKNISGDIVRMMTQTQLPASDADAQALVESSLEKVLELKGEGIMLRRGHSMWTPYRHEDLVKVKPEKDSEAHVMGYVMGYGKHENSIGALRVRWNQKIFDIGSGLVDSDRVINLQALNSGEELAGTLLSKDIGSKFPVGSMVTFKYTELTQDGVPRFPRVWRKHEEV